MHPKRNEGYNNKSHTAKMEKKKYLLSITERRKNMIKNNKKLKNSYINYDIERKAEKNSKDNNIRNNTLGKKRKNIESYIKDVYNKKTHQYFNNIPSSQRLRGRAIYTYPMEIGSLSLTAPV